MEKQNTKVEEDHSTTHSKSFFSKWMDHWRKVKLETTKQKTDFNWNTFFIVLACLSAISIISVAILGVFLVKHTESVVSNAVSEFTGVITGAGESIARTTESNPELLIDMLDQSSYSLQDKEKLLMMMIAKQMSASTDISGSFTGKFTTKNVREMVKQDPACIDKFRYGTFRTSSSLESDLDQYMNTRQYEEKLKDEGCIFYHSYRNVSFYKCPKNNCEKKIVIKQTLDEFIPEKLVVSRVDASLNE